MNNLLLAQGLHRAYPSGKGLFYALKGIDLEIARGEFLVIMGPSGAGKSTLLHLLGGLDRPSRGKIIFEGVDLGQLDEAGLSRLRAKRIGFVFQFYHLLAEFTVFENIRLASFLGQNSGGRKEAVKVLSRVGLEDKAGNFPYQLSGGERQRAAIARALVNSPDVIFCDEPTGNLDSRTGEKIINLLSELNQKEKKTLVIVTHEKEIVRQASRVIEIRDGRIEGRNHENIS